MTVHRLSCYMNIPTDSKLFIQIVRETSFRETFCPGKWLSGKGLVRETSYPRNVLSGKRLSGKVALRQVKPFRSKLGGSAGHLAAFHIGAVAIDGRDMTFGTVRIYLGGCRSCSSPPSLPTVPRLSVAQRCFEIQWNSCLRCTAKN